ncbi:MAG: hypothetical protein RLY78_1600 [Pseudomonadota bacterium]
MSDSPAALGHLVAPAHWRRIDLLSDVHLHAQAPATAALWCEHLRHTDADAVLMLGDLFEVWVGDDARHQGFEQQMLQVLREASARLTLAFLPGNRDFLLGAAMAADAGLLLLDDPCLLEAFGQRWLLGHGDAWCVDDMAYQRFRAQVRSPAWQQAFLAQPLAERQRQARTMREASQARQAGLAAADYGEVDPGCAAQALHTHGATTLIHGHTHRPGCHALPGGGTRHVLGDWDAEATPPRARWLRLDAQGLHPRDAARPAA